LPEKRYKDIHVSLNSQMEGSRVVSGCISYGPGEEGSRSHLKNLIYTVEVACALNREEKAIRVSLYDQATRSSFMNVVFVDRSLFEQGQSMTDEVGFALRSGFTDSLAIVQKIACLNHDYQKYELNEEIRLKLEESRSVDLTGDGKDFGAGKATKGSQDKSSGSSVPVKRSRERESAFVSLAKLKERMINRSLKENTLIYRKVLRLDGGRKNVTISALRESNPMYEQAKAGAVKEGALDTATRKPIWHDQYLIKLILSENKRIERDN